MFKKILVALDGSAHARKALLTAVQLAGQCDAVLVLFHGMQSGNLGPGYATKISAAALEVYEKVIHEQAEAILDEAQRLAAEHGVTSVERRAAEDDSAARAILNAAKSAGAELVVVGTRGLTGLRELAMGSVAHQVTAHADCPVLVVR